MQERIISKLLKKKKKKKRNKKIFTPKVFVTKEGPVKYRYTRLKAALLFLIYLFPFDVEGEK